MSKALLLGAGTSGVVSPIPPSNLALWLKADAITGLADLATVAAWNDSSVNARNMTQATEANKPIYRTNIVNSLPVVRFDGSNDYLLRNGSIVTGEAGSIFVVASRLVGAVGTDHYCGVGDTSGSNDGRIDFGVNGTMLMDIRVGANRVWGSSAIVAGSWYVHEFSSDGAAYEMRLNGAVQVLDFIAGSNDGKWGADLVGPDNFIVGAIHTTGPTGYALADIAEIVLYDGAALSTGDKSTIRSYLGTKYAITVT